MSRIEEPSWAGRSDADLLAEFVQNRREAAFAEIVRRHGGMVLSVCRSVLANTSDAEDAMQAVFLTLAQKASSRPAGPSLAGWLHRVAWYVSVRAAKARHVHRSHEQAAARLKQESAHAEQAPMAPQQLHAVLASLPEKYRVPLLVHHLEGRTQEETAALLGCGVSALAMRLSRGRQLLGRRLASRGLVASVGVLAGLMTAQASTAAPAALVAATSKAAAAALAGSATSALGVSSTVLALSKGAANMLFWAKVKAILVAATLVLAVGGTVGTYITVAATSTDQTTPPYAMGTISHLADGSIILESNGKPVTVTYDASTVFNVAGQPAKAADLKVGMRAYARGQAGQPAMQIQAYMPTTAPTAPTKTAAPTTTAAPMLAMGTITQVGEGSITVESSGKAVTVTFDASTVINVAGQLAKAADLKIGMRAYARGQAGQPATQIQAYMPTTAPTAPTKTPVSTSTAAPMLAVGIITQVGEGSITVESSGKAVTVAYDASTVINVAGQPAKAADLKIGMRAYARGQAGQPAAQIQAYMPTAAPTKS